MTAPLVLIIDDRTGDYADAFSAKLSEGGRVSALALHPADLQLAHVERASLILIDYKLSDWPSRDHLAEISLQPKDGIALAGLLRRHANGGTAVALISSNIQEAFQSVSERNRRHQLSRVEALEWVFEKGDEYIETQVCELAHAVSCFRNSGVAGFASLGVILEFPKVSKDVSEIAMSDVRRCIPPIHDLEAMTSGIAFVRWFSQRILPYPTFLIDTHQLAARLRISVDTLSKLLATESDLVKLLDRYTYSGVLPTFLGRRWWKAGIDEMTWTLTRNRTLPKDAIQAEISKLAGQRVDLEALSDPVVVFDEDLIPTNVLKERAECIRLLPDDWPAYADAPYAEVTLVSEAPGLREIVHPSDLWRLEEAGPQ